MLEYSKKTRRDHECSEKQGRVRQQILLAERLTKEAGFDGEVRRKKENDFQALVWKKGETTAKRASIKLVTDVKTD